MTTATTHMYEIMFLISQGTAARFGEVIEHINTIFERSSIELVSMQKWDERRLAYEMDKQKRGVYLLAYVNAEPGSIASFERDCNLSEQIMRVLVLRADHLTIEEAQAFDRREDLMAEAKLRAETAEAEQEQTRKTATLGAPTPEADAVVVEETVEVVEVVEVVEAAPAGEAAESTADAGEKPE
jgi:small subunit ribosomal protein S6